MEIYKKKRNLPFYYGKIPKKNGSFHNKREVSIFFGSFRASKFLRNSHLPHAASHGHGAHPNYVTRFEFRLFRALVNIRLTALQNSNNQIQQQMQQINQNIQNMNNQMQQQMQQINHNMNNQIQQLGQQIQNQINTVEQRLNRLERH